MGERIKWQGVLSEKGDVKHSLWVRQVKSGQVGIQPSIWRTEIRNSSRCTDACASLPYVLRFDA